MKWREDRWRGRGRGRGRRGWAQGTWHDDNHPRERWGPWAGGEEEGEGEEGENGLDNSRLYSALIDPQDIPRKGIFYEVRIDVFETQICVPFTLLLPFSMTIVKTLPLPILDARNHHKYARHSERPDAIQNVLHPLRGVGEIAERKAENHTTGDTAVTTDLDVKRGRGEGREGSGGRGEGSGRRGEGAQDGKKTTTH